MNIPRNVNRLLDHLSGKDANEKDALIDLMTSYYEKEPMNIPEDERVMNAYTKMYHAREIIDKLICYPEMIESIYELLIRRELLEQNEQHEREYQRYATMKKIQEDSERQVLKRE